MPPQNKKRHDREGVIIIKMRYYLFTALIVAVTVSGLQAESIRFAVVGDTRGWTNGTINETVFSKIIQEVMAVDPPVQFVIVTGDLVTGTEDDSIMAGGFQNWRQIAKPWYDASFLGAKVYVLPGNHDEVNPLTYVKLWQDAFPELPDNGPAGDQKMTYSFDIGPVHFSMVNTDIPTPDGIHSVNLAWLANDLDNSTQPIKLVLGHEPAYSIGPHVGSSLDAKPDLRDAFWQMLAAKKVSAYICSHEHLYDHWIKDNVHQIISGGGGGPGLDFHYMILDADENDVTVSVYGQATNALWDQYKLSDTANVPSEDRSSTTASLAGWLKMLPCAPVAILLLGGIFFLDGFVNEPNRKSRH
ncbi:MAG: metallophosphoesterase [Phycisphaerae bacterium]